MPIEAVAAGVATGGPAVLGRVCPAGHRRCRWCRLRLRALNVRNATAVPKASFRPPTIAPQPSTITPVTRFTRRPFHIYGLVPRLTAVPKARLLKPLAAVGTPAGSPCGDDARLDAADIEASQAARAERRIQEYENKIEEAMAALDAAQDFLNRVPYDAKRAARAYDNIDTLNEKVAYYQKHKERLKEAMRSSSWDTTGYGA